MMAVEDAAGTRQMTVGVLAKLVLDREPVHRSCPRLQAPVCRIRTSVCLIGIVRDPQKNAALTTASKNVLTLVLVLFEPAVLHRRNLLAAL